MPYPVYRLEMISVRVEGDWRVQRGGVREAFGEYWGRFDEVRREEMWWDQDRYDEDSLLMSEIALVKEGEVAHPSDCPPGFVWRIMVGEAATEDRSAIELLKEGKRDAINHLIFFEGRKAHPFYVVGECRGEVFTMPPDEYVDYYLCAYGAPRAKRPERNTFLVRVTQDAWVAEESLNDSATD